jgi:predicted membrane protein
MTNAYGRRCTPRLFFGLLIMALGVLFTLDKLGFIDVGDYWRYWPLFLIAAGLGRVVQPRRDHGRGWGFILLVVGTWLLLANLDLIPYDLVQYWPILLILVGAGILWRALAGPRWQGPTPPPGLVDEGGTDMSPKVPSSSAVASSDGSDAVVNAVAILGGIKRRSTSQDFRGGDLTALLGGCELDLRQASITSSEAVLDVFAFWGGIDIKVPLDWSVVVRGTPIMGAFEDKTKPVLGGRPKTLVIKGAVVMGGVGIGN